MTDTQQGPSGYTVYREAEHQELWYPGADLTRPVDVHITSALGVLGHFVCVRVPEEYADRLGNVEVKARIGGLRPDDLHLMPGQGVSGPDRYPSAAEGQVWRILCRAFISRGDGALEFVGWPDDLKQAVLLLCTWPRYIASGQADQWLACQADPKWAPTGIPLGGIGCGKVDLCRDGRFRNFSANNNQDMPLEEPAGLGGAYLAVTCAGETRSLASSPVADAQPCSELSFQGRFPQAELSAPDCLPGLQVTVTASGAFCPHDLRRSCIPGMLVRWRLKNAGEKELKARCEFHWPNLIGQGGGIGQEETDIGKGDGIYCYWEETEGRKELPAETHEYVAVRFVREGKCERESSSGEHLLVVARRDGVEPASEAGDGCGCVSGEVVIAPGSEEVLDMALIWAMPHWTDTKGTDRGHLWQEHFSDADEMAREVLASADEIFEQAGSLAHLLDQTSLPDWLKARLSNCNYPLVTNSVLYRDGRFSINEGPTEMSGCYGTIDQRLGAHPGTQLFFPELNAQELSQFAAYQSPNGGINHDLGAGHLESGPRDQPWPDIPCSFIIQTARHAWSTGDEAFEDEMWPRARQALLRHSEWAEEGKGVAQVGFGLGTSYDGYHYEGTTPYLGTLWLAALAVIEEWAKRKDDTELLPRIEQWRAAAIERMDADIWNGQFYVTCGQAGGPRRETSHAGQLAGQFYSRMLTGRDVLPPERLGPCVEALMNLNGSHRFAVPPDEVTPEGESDVMFGWLPYVEAFCLPAAASIGDERVMEVWERMIRSMDQDGERLCDTRLMYRPSTGEPSWGSYYMTAPASWLVYDALLDFAYWPGEGVLRLHPRLRGKLAVIHPLWWGLAEVGDDEISLRIERVFNSKPLHVRCIELRSPAPESPSLRRYKRKELPEPVNVSPGAEMRWSVSG